MDIYNEVRKIWEIIPTSPNVRNKELSDVLYKKMVSIFQVGSHYNYIVNVRNPAIEYISPDVKEVLGYTENDITLSFFVSLIHPEDAPFFVNFEAAIARFFENQPEHELFNYKVQYDLRFRHADGRYKRMLHQFIVIQHDADDVRTFAVDTDITHLKNSGTSQLSFVGLNGASSYYNVDTNDTVYQVTPLFTKRERQILTALAGGLNSQEVGDKLNISRHTVDVHRKNLLRKAEVRSTFDLVQKAQNNGWV